MTLPIEKRFDPPRQWHRIRMIENPLIRNGLVVLAIGYICWSIISLDIDWGRIIIGFPRALNIVARMIPPDYSRWELLLRGVLESVQMALVASFFGKHCHAISVSPYIG
jgi:phosphonate transport system permease protein